MASVVETTAVSLRKGNTSECDNFTGVLGELVMCTGDSGEGTDINTGLRLHNGITQGGIVIANASMTNVNTKALARNRHLVGDKNLAYADLSNLETLYDTTAIATVLTTLHSYGLATVTQIEQLDSLKANRTMDNVLSSTLAEGRTEDAEGKNGNLAYANMRNVNTKYLANSSYRTGLDDDKALSYADVSNVNTTNLTLPSGTRPTTMQGPMIARADLSNVDDSVINNRISDLNVEYKTNKDTYINSKSTDLMTHYPTVGAVIDYVSDEIEKLDFLDPYFKNAKSWEALYTNELADIHFDDDISLLTTQGTNFTVKQQAFADSISKQVSTLAPTNLSSTGIFDAIPLQIAIYALDSGDEEDPTKLQPAVFRLYPEYGTTNVTEQTITFVTEAGSELIGTIKSVAHPNLLGVYKYVFTETSVSGYDWEAIPAGMNTSIINAPKYNSVTPINVIPVLCVEIADVNENGGITDLIYVPSFVNTVVPSTESIIYHPILADETVQTGNNANTTIKTINNLPLIGGAGLLKSNLDNLPGMTEVDISANAGAKWTINKNKTIDRASVTIPVEEYDRLITAGQLYDCVKNTTAVTIRKWS